MSNIIENLLLEVKLKLGEPIRKTPIEDSELKTLLKMTIEDCFLYAGIKKNEKVEVETFTTLNNAQKTIVRNLLIAESKILMGTIFSKFSGKIDDNVTLDYSPLLEQGYKEKHLIIEELKDLKK